MLPKFTHVQGTKLIWEKECGNKRTPTKCHKLQEIRNFPEMQAELTCTILLHEHCPGERAKPQQARREEGGIKG